jgi:hypothetical protein
MKTIILSLVLYIGLVFAQDKPDSTLYNKYQALNQQAIDKVKTAEENIKYWTQECNEQTGRAKAFYELWIEEKTKLDSLKIKEKK